MSLEETVQHMHAWLEGRERHVGEDLDEVDRRLEVLHRYLDDANPVRDPVARTLTRLAKVAEELGEVMQAYIGVIGSNPSKGVYDTIDHVADELLDVVVTALLAYAHVRPTASPMQAFEAHLESLLTRANLT